MKTNVFKYFVLLIALSACNEGKRNFEALQKVKEGMHINEVHNIMPNDPKLTRIPNVDMDWLVESYAAKRGSSGRYNIYYEMKDSTVAKVTWEIELHASVRGLIGVSVFWN